MHWLCFEKENKGIGPKIFFNKICARQKNYFKTKKILPKKSLSLLMSNKW
jgi:hypothetical protein